MRDVLVGILAVAAACSSESKGSQSKDQPAPPPALVGVFPDDFQCDSIAAPSALASILGATPRQLESQMTPPSGLARPCEYIVDRPEAGVEKWFFDIDCRPTAVGTAEALFEQYRTANAKLIEEYNAAAAAGRVTPLDGGPPPRAPEAAFDVDVGAKGLDHHGQGILFVDDDAPCYVRVVGPDAERRLALARLVARELTLARAPMKPRAAPSK